MERSACLTSHTEVFYVSNVRQQHINDGLTTTNDSIGQVPHFVALVLGDVSPVQHRFQVLVDVLWIQHELGGLGRLRGTGTLGT